MGEEQATQLETKHSLLAFFEHPLFTLPIGILGGLVGILFYTPILLVCGACVILAFHRARVVSMKSIRSQIVSYALLCFVTAGTLYALHRLIQHGLERANISLSDIIISRLKSAHIGAEEKTDKNRPLTPSGTKAPTNNARPGQKHNPRTAIHGDLEVVSFSSWSNLIVVNRYDKPIYVIDILCFLQHPTYTSRYWDLGFEVPPGRISRYDFKHDPFVTIGSRGDTWDSHFLEVIKMYGQCASTEFLSQPVVLEQIHNNYAQQGIVLRTGEATGIVHYRVGDGVTIDKTFAFTAIMVKGRDCQPMKPN